MKRSSSRECQTRSSKERLGRLAKAMAFHMEDATIGFLQRAHTQRSFWLILSFSYYNPTKLFYCLLVFQGHLT
jgi:hypothetical protein